MAGTLDRAAQAARDAPKRRHRWAQAVDLLDKFLSDNLEPPRRREMRFQAGVYRWATAQSWLDTAEASPGDPKPRQEAVAALDDAIERFRSSAAEAITRPWAITSGSAWPRPSPTAPGSSRRDRPAGSLASPKLSICSKTRRANPGSPASGPCSRPTCSRRSGKLDEAEKQLEAAVKSTPPPSDGELAEVKVPLFLEQEEIRGSRLRS